MAERAYINQRLQFGAEVTPGTGVAATKLIQCLDIVFGPMADVAQFTPTGRKYPAVVIENSEWVEGTLNASILDYNGAVYPLSSAAGPATITAHGASLIAKDWTFNPPLTGSIVPQTFTIEQGDTAGNAIYNHKFAYGLFSELAYKGDRKTGFQMSGKLLAQQLQTAITMTASPTAITLAPTAGKHFNVYLDSTFAGLGVTQLNKVLNLDFTWANIYGMFFPLNRAQLGWTAHVDLKPTAVIKVLLEMDATGVAQIPILEAGTTQFMQINAQGSVIDNNQTVTLGVQSSGTFTLTYKGQTTGGIAWNATSATVATALQGLSTIGGTGCTVAGGVGGPYVVTFTGLLSLDTTVMTGSGASLTTPANFGITQTQVYAAFKHNMAVKVSKPNPFQDKDGIFAEEYEFTVVEDSASGLAHQFVCTNLLTAL